MIQKYAKFINEKIVHFPPTNGQTGQDINYFVDEEKLKRDGYKPFIPADCPSDGKAYEDFYVEKNGKILQTWQEILKEEPIFVEETAEVKRERAYRSLTDGWEAELAYKTRKGYPSAELALIEAKIDEAREEIKKMYPDDSE